jgi:competence ComEA-like helix-hairpin-helix protein
MFPFDPNTATADDFERLGLSAKTARSILNYREKGGRFRKPEDLAKIYTLSSADFERLRPFIAMNGPNTQKLFHGEPSGDPEAFDPNTASIDVMERAGLPVYLAERIVKYREKGGVFRKKEDLKRLYGMNDALYARIEPYIEIAGASTRDTVPTNAKRTGTYTRKSSAPLDINTAGVEQWQTLPGIGAWRAERIVAYRDKLGGFLSAEQVAETYGLPDSIYQPMKPYLLGGGVLQTLNVNSCTIEELKAHPYISPKEAGHIMAYRAQHGQIKSVDDLKLFFEKNVKWEDVKRYLSF